MSAPTPSEAPVLTAAEKAEIRRRKILAKKNARMAYAAGKRSALPSEAPSEPINEFPDEAPTTSSDAARGENGYGAQHVVSDRPVVADPSLRYQSHDYSRLQTRDVMGAALAVLNTRAVRLTIITLLTVVYTVATAFDYIPRWRVSAVELFFSAEVCFLVPGMIGAIRNRSKRMSASTHGGEAFPFTVLRLLSNIQDSVILLRRAVNEFSVFMFVFLCTWYLVESLT